MLSIITIITQAVVDKLCCAADLVGGGKGHAKMICVYVCVCYEKSNDHRPAHTQANKPCCAE